MTTAETIRNINMQNQMRMQDAIRAANRFREQDSYFKSHDGMDTDPTTANVEAPYDWTSADRTADAKNESNDREINDRL